MPIIDNGDGTITTEDGIRIAKPFGMGAGMPPPDLGTAQLDPSVIDAAQRPTDQLAQMGPMGNPVWSPTPAQESDARALASDAVHQVVTPLEQLRKEKPIVLGDQDMTPEVTAARENVAPEDRVQVGGGGGAAEMPQYGPPRVIAKGGMRPVQQTIQKGTKLPGDIKDQAAENVLSHRAANEAGRLASEQENTQTAEAASGYATAAEERLAKEQERATRHQVAMNDAMTKFDAMSNEARANPINQDAYWQEKGAGSRVLAGLWAAMGEVSKGKGESNTALGIIDKQINDWVSSKRESRAQGLEGQRNLISQARENFQNEAAQNAAMRAQAYDVYRAKLGAITAGAATEKDKATALAVDADLADKALDWRTKAAELEADHVTVHEKQVAPTVVGGAPKLGALPRELVVQDLNGNKFLGRDPEQTRTLNKNLPLTKIAMDAAATMARVSEKSAGEKLDPNSSAGKEFAFAQEQFVNSMNALAAQGVVRSDDIDRYKDYTGGKFGLSTAEASRKLASKASTAYNYQLRANADTETKVAEDFQENPKTGATEKVAHYQMFPGQGGSRVPIAFKPAGKRHKK